MERIARNLNRVFVRKYGLSSRRNPIQIHSGELAKFANGASTTQLGDTTVLTTVVCEDKEDKPSSGPSSFVPLLVDYKEKAAAAGRIPTTHLRRDIGFTEKETLTSRMIDRAVRPGFLSGFNYNTQIVCDLLAVDGQNDPDVLAINGASASLALSDIPWNGPVGAVRIGLIEEELIFNPTRLELEKSKLNLVMATNHIGNLIMLEGYCKEPLPDREVLSAVSHGIVECKNITRLIKDLQKKCKKEKRNLDLTKFQPTKEHLEFVLNQGRSKIMAVFEDYSHDKISRGKAMDEIQRDLKEQFINHFEGQDASMFPKAYVKTLRTLYAQLLMTKQRRCDGRKFHEIRPITCRADLYKPLHGSALFQRGQTQVLCSATYDSPDAAFRNDPMSLFISGMKEKNFMLHYEFMPFSTNETGRISTFPGRREVGHGVLAERALRPVVPEENEMTIRLNCEVLESSGSSSMASVCAGSLAMMDASVKLKEHVAGISMGVIGYELDSDIRGKKTQIEPLVDITGLEDFLGDMDFKIAGTATGITAFQLDVKPTDGIAFNTICNAAFKNQAARVYILKKMDKVFRKPRQSPKENHPVMKKIKVPPHKRAKLIGFGGINLKKLMSKTGVRLSVLPHEQSGEETNMTNDEYFMAFAPNKEAMAEAEEYIEKILTEDKREPELQFNNIYTATIVDIKPNGVMVTLYPGMTPALLHLSQLDTRIVMHPSALDMTVGQELQVKYFGRDPVNGQMRLSRKSLLMSSLPRTMNYQKTSDNDADKLKSIKNP